MIYESCDRFYSIIFMKIKTFWVNIKSFVFNILYLSEKISSIVILKLPLIWNCFLNFDLCIWEHDINSVLLFSQHNSCIVPKMHTSYCVLFKIVETRNSIFQEIRLDLCFYFAYNSSSCFEIGYNMYVEPQIKYRWRNTSWVMVVNQ